MCGERWDREQPTQDIAGEFPVVGDKVSTFRRVAAGMGQASQSYSTCEGGRGEGRALTHQIPSSLAEGCFQTLEILELAA